MIDITDTNLASVPAINPYLKSAQSCAIDYLPLLQSAGIDPSVLEYNNQRISVAAMEKLLLLLIGASGDQCFGLHSSRFIEPASYSVLGYISMNCSSLRDIQAKIPIYEKIVGDMGVTSVELSDGFAWLSHSAHQFGFSLSYPRDNPLGFIYEPWHWCFNPA